MGDRRTLVVATTNRGKLRELQVLLRGLSVDVRSVAEVMGKQPIVVEDGATFEENAVKKARTIANATQQLTLADDSGLEVDALAGRPGVRSARFAHEGATDADNNAALLAALTPRVDGTRREGSPPPLLCARFRCVLALVDPLDVGGEASIARGVCEGRITRRPRGTGGFGYDPLFVPEGGDQTMAELSESEKNRVSHRARALAALRPLIERALALHPGAASHCE